MKDEFEPLSGIDCRVNVTKGLLILASTLVLWLRGCAAGCITKQKAIHHETQPETGTPPKTPEFLAQARLDAKAEENTARAKRVEIEEELLSILPCREEGSQTNKLENGMRVVTEGRMTRSIDAKALQDDWNDLYYPRHIPLEA